MPPPIKEPEKNTYDKGRGRRNQKHLLCTAVWSLKSKTFLPVWIGHKWNLKHTFLLFLKSSSSVYIGLLKLDSVRMAWSILKRKKWKEK
jgi:hypothetical protein